MKSKKYALVVLSVFLILLVFASSASAADVNGTDVLSIDESTNTVNEKLALDYSSGVSAVTNDSNVIENNGNNLLSADNGWKNVLKENTDDDQILGGPDIGPMTVSGTWYVNASAVPNGDGSEANPFNTLNDALTNSELKDDDTIMIASGEYKGTNNTGLEINKNLNFIKYGDAEAIFNAEQSGRIWTVTATSINITGLTFKNGKADDGGAIYFTNNISNSNINASFINNYAEASGGANYFYGTVSDSIVTGTYINNRANGAGFAIGGGANFFYGTVSDSIVAGTYTTNTAAFQGGANYFFGDFSTSVSDSIVTGTYYNNSAGYDGGGANFFWGWVSGSNVTGTYTNNNAMNGGANQFLGGVGSSTVSGTYINNKAYGSEAINGGGANFFDCSVSDLNVTGTYINNTATSCGGANFFFGDVPMSVSNSNIGGIYINNTSPEAIIYFKDNQGTGVDAKITNGIFLNNHYADIIYTRTGGVVVEDCWFGNNASNYMDGPSIGNVQRNNWLFLNASADPAELNLGDNSTVTFELYSYNGTSEPSLYDASKMDILLDLTQTLGELDKTNASFGEGIKYTAKENGNGSVTGKFETAFYSIYLKNNEAPLINVVAENLTKYFGGPEPFIVNVTDKDGKGVPDKNVSITLNGVNYNRTTDEEGIAYLSINLNSGTYDVNVTVDSITVNATVTILSTVFGSDITKVYNETAAYKATFLDSNGEYLNNTEVSFNINGKSQKETTDDKGLASLDINLPVGNYTVTAMNPVTGENAANKITVTQAESDITVNAYNITFGEADAKIADIILPSDATGNVTVTIGTNTTVYDIQTYPNKTSRGGKIDMFIYNNGLKAGEYNISATYEGDNNYKASFGKDKFSVSKKDLNLNASTFSISENTTIIVTGFENATGNVSITVDGNEFNSTIMIGFVFASIPKSDKNLTAYIYYPGDENYNNASASVDIIVKKDLNLTVSVDPIHIGENATLVITGFENATGNVMIIAGRGFYNVTITNSTATATISGLNNTTSAIIIYLGDDNYNMAFTSVNITVLPETPKENLTISASAEPITVGDNATVVVTGLENATGEVYVIVGIDEMYSAPIKDGEAIVIVPGLTETVTVVVDYPGDETYNNASTTVNITVNPGSINIDAPDLIKYFGGPESFAVNVTDSRGVPLSNKTVFITINGRTYNRTTDENGTASMAIGLPSGKYDATVTVYDQTVSSVITVLPTVAGSDITKVYGETAAYNATFLDSEGKYLPKGTEVSFNINGNIQKETTDDKGLASLNINLPVGNYTVTAMNPVTGENTANTITVTQAESDIVVYAHNITVSEGNALIADIILPSDATGNVTVTIGNNTAVYDVQTSNHTSRGGKIDMFIYNNGLKAGEYTISATYGGDNNYKASSGKDKFIVSKKDLNIEANAEPITAGDNATVVVTGLENATGDVSVIVNGKTYTAPINNSEASVTVPGLTENVTAAVNYNGDDNYNPASTTVNITVNPNIKINAPDLIKYYGDPERFAVNVTDSRGAPLSNKTVFITINGKTYNRTTDENGTASMAIGLPSGTYNATVTVDNQTVSSVITLLPTVNGTDVVKMYRNGTQYYATFLDSEGKYLADGTTVKFNINGVFYERKVSGDKGLAKLNINLPAGEYIITASNPVTGEMASNNVTVLPTIVENRDITKYYKNATQYTVKVLGADGNPVGAGKTVTFNINGVMYQRQTNELGIAQLNINLPPGDYVITASYEGYNVANNITVLPVLSASDLRMKYMDGSKFKATLLDGQGKPYAEQKIQFNVNGVLYNRGTDSNGQAELNIRLPAGEYIITSSYNGANIANKITITP